MKKALITGITGQDGSYLAEFLLHKGYNVHGIIRRSSTFNTERIDHIFSKLHLHYGDLSDGTHLANIINDYEPDEIYNLGAQSHVKVSFESAVYTSDICALGTLRMLEIIKASGQDTKFYQASSSEMFGSTPPPQNEESAFKPRSPYACSKVYAYWTVKNYREGYDIFASNGILFNHESPRRGGTFVTRKITQGIVNIIKGKQKYLHLGNLNAKRDWGFAPEYCMNMWNILQQYEPNDYVLGTTYAYTIKDFLERAFVYAGLKWSDYVVIDKQYFRPTETESLIADTSKAERDLNWKPKISFLDLIKIMMDADMRKAGLGVIGEGDEIIKNKFPDKWWEGD